MKPATPIVLENPFPGLRPFRQEEEHLFFGRESQVDRMVDKLSASKFLAVVGTSGTGKSSLVNCGLKPALHRGLMASAGSSWAMVQFRPGGDPIRSMAEAFAAQTSFQGNVSSASSSSATPSLCDMMETTLRMSSLGLANIFEYAHLPKGANLLLVVDQFEELFRYAKAGNGPQDAYGVSTDAIAFVNLLLEAHAHPDYPIYIVLTMRSDFLGECSQFNGLPEVINEGQYLVPRLTRDERRAAIAGPIGVVGGELSPVLLTRLLNDVGDNPDQLSILQHAINRTWASWQAEDPGEGPLSLKHYEAVGTMAHALDLHAEKAFAELQTPEQRKLCEKVFKALTDKGTDARGIRRPMPFQTLCSVVGATPDEVLPVLAVFRKPSRAFLMPPLAEDAGPNTVIDISHEVLMRVWERLKVWAEEEAQSAAIYRRLAETAQLYDTGRAALWRDPDLQTAFDWQWDERPTEAWAQLYRPGFASALAFLAASKTVRDNEAAEREFARRWRRLTPYLVCLAFGIFVLLLPKLSEPVHNSVRSVVQKFTDNPATDVQQIDALQEKIASAKTKRKVGKALIDASGFFVDAAICLLSYAGLWFGGRRVYRHFTFPAIAARVGARVETRKEIEARAGQPEQDASGTASTAQKPMFAPLWRRLLAGIVDILAFLIMAVLMILAAALLADYVTRAGGGFAWVIGLFYILVPIIAILYPAVSVFLWGRTLGDLVCGIAVTDRSGKRPGFLRMVGRTVLGILAWLVPFVLALVFAMAGLGLVSYVVLGLAVVTLFFTRRKPAIYDLATRIILIRYPRRIGAAN